MSQSESSDGSIGYYETGDDTDVTGGSIEADDPEYFEYKVCNRREADKLFEEFKAKVLTSQQVKSTLDEVIDKLLQQLDCSVDEERSACKKKSRKLYSDSDERLPHPSQKKQRCGVCVNEPTQVYTASCGHTYCNRCWSSHIETKLSYSFHSDIECMDKDCNVILTEDMVLAHLTQRQTREKYLRFSFTSYINMHPCLRFCPGPDCSAIIYAREKKERKVFCPECKISFCFACGMDYHAPTSCENMQKWLQKCTDDSETDNYLLAYTKKCPNCTIHIEKNGGCRTMRCSICGKAFCWDCGGLYNIPYDTRHCCQDNPPLHTAEEIQKAKVNLNTYRDCFYKWENHAKRLKLEAEDSKKISEKIEQKVLAMEGTWIDWQYLTDAPELLKRCRYTLQYTYPYAYYLKNTDSKQLFQRLQGRLEVEVKSLSWKIQKARITDRGDLVNDMRIIEQIRRSLLKDQL